MRGLLPAAIGERVALLLVALLALASLAIAIAPEPQPRPLVAPAGIEVARGFIRNDPPRDFEVRRGVRESPWFATWRSWTPAEGAVPGDARSAQFAMPPYVAVAYQGFAGAPGIGLWLECESDGARLPVAEARTNTQWAEAIVARPPGWCAGGGTRLVAHSDSRERYLAFGTPFEVSRLSAWKARYAGLFGLGLLLFALVAGFCVAAAAALRRAWPQGDPIASGLVGLGVFGYALFFVFDASRSAGNVVAGAGVAVALAGLALLAGWRPRGARDAGADVLAWRAPLLCWGVVACAFTALLFAADAGAGAWTANARFAPVRWSTDNQLPMLVAEHLVRLDLAKIDLGPWLVSDRTPLSYGLHAWLRSVAAVLARGADGPHLAWQFHALAGIVINTAWVAVAWRLLRGVGLAPRRAALLLAALAALPFCLFNSIYTWPKLLAAAFGLAAIVQLLRPLAAHADGTTAPAATRWVQAALLSALALLSHGGAVFGILAMLAVAFAAHRDGLRPGVLLRAGAAAVALLLPWMAWQRLVQPGGNALLKSVFGGTFGFDEREVGVVETIARSYAALSPGEWLGMKLEGLRSLLLPPAGDTCGMGEMVPGATGLGAARIADFLALAPSVKFLWLGLLVALVPAWRRAATHRHAALALLGVGLLGIVVDLVLAWDCQIIHTQSYQSILAIALGLLLLLADAPRALRNAALGATFAYALAAWIVEPLRSATRLDAPALEAFAAICVWAALAAWRLPSQPRVAGNGP